MKASKLLVTLALSAVLFTGCGVKNQNAIIKINDQAITQAEYEKLMDRSIGQSPFGKMGDLKGNKDGFLYLMMEQNVVNQLIIKELLDQHLWCGVLRCAEKYICNCSRNMPWTWLWR